jgi:hypothetical protein
MLNILTDELVNDPAGKGYAAFLPDDPTKVVELLSLQTEMVVRPLRSTTAKAWAASGPYAAIVDASNNTSHPCRASCLVIRDVFASGDQIHIEEADIQGMLAAWVQTGICTQAQVDDLINRAKQPASRADALGIPLPTARDVLDAWGSK